MHTVRVTDYHSNQRYMETYVELEGEDLSPSNHFADALQSCQDCDRERMGVTSSQPYFQSDSWQDIEAVDQFVEAMKSRYPDAHIFYLRGE